MSYSAEAVRGSQAAAVERGDQGMANSQWLSLLISVEDCHAAFKVSKLTPVLWKLK